VSIEHWAEHQGDHPPRDRTETHRSCYRSTAPSKLIHHRLHEYGQNILKDTSLCNANQKGDTNDDPAIKWSAQVAPSFFGEVTAPFPSVGRELICQQ